MYISQCNVSVRYYGRSTSTLTFHNQDEHIMKVELNKKAETKVWETWNTRFFASPWNTCVWCSWIENIGYYSYTVVLNKTTGYPLQGLSDTIRGQLPSETTLQTWFGKTMVSFQLMGSTTCVVTDTWRNMVNGYLWNNMLEHYHVAIKLLLSI